MKHTFWLVYMNNLGSGKEEKYTKKKKNQGDSRKVVEGWDTERWTEERDTDGVRQTLVQPCVRYQQVRAASAVPDIHSSLLLESFPDISLCKNLYQLTIHGSSPVLIK